MVAVVTWALAAGASGNAASPASSAITMIEGLAVARPWADWFPLAMTCIEASNVREYRIALTFVRNRDNIPAANAVSSGSHARCWAQPRERRVREGEKTACLAVAVGYIERTKDKCAPHPKGTTRVATRGTTRAINRGIALNLIRTNQPISRADLARLMGTRRGAVSLLVGELIRRRRGVRGRHRRSPARAASRPFSTSTRASAASSPSTSGRPAPSSW